MNWPILDDAAVTRLRTYVALLRTGALTVAQQKSNKQVATDIEALLTERERLREVASEAMEKADKQERRAQRAEKYLRGGKHDED